MLSFLSQIVESNLQPGHFPSLGSLCELQSVLQVFPTSFSVQRTTGLVLTEPVLFAFTAHISDAPDRENYRSHGLLPPVNLEGIPDWM